MTDRTRYGDLMHEAAAGIAAASVGIGREPFFDRAEAEQAIAAYRGLLHAMNRHGWQLFGSETRVTGIRVSRKVDASDASAVRLVDALASVGRRTPTGDAQPLATATSAWRAAGVCVRTATDLLGTHRGIDGEWRSPQAQMLEEPGVRAVGFADLAGLVIPVAEVSSHLGLRAGQAGIPWRQVERLLPPTQTLVDIAVEVRASADVHEGPSRLRAVEVARPPIRMDDPLVELADRLARVHRTSWQLTREDFVGIATLGDLAAAGVLVNEHVRRVLRQASRFDVENEAFLEPLVNEGSVAWRRVHLYLRQLRSTAPGITQVRADVLAIQRRLNQLGAPVDHALGPNQIRQFRSVIIGGTRAFTEIARWNSAVVDHLACTGQLFVPGRLLAGDEVTDHPALVEVKLSGRLAAATQNRLQPLRAAYEAAQRAPVRANDAHDVGPSVRYHVASRQVLSGDEVPL